ncbi:Oidioi.mRNA.OKI2018_I69.XSR.g16990.t1.cds [Oikopleura dioica]|uniref:Oidioi.mRNA.OKI2018_I69.XSR.g16990.t1.cds n=1 Tax=Oikopleura dioica TaxID=34765 RepID=A0ABN7SLM9_OIKDI|nr:Oidioi.mRNA.OKI2018_I69.XSR.g16990.t1.cds [Oikopleura dioica]
MRRAEGRSSSDGLRPEIVASSSFKPPRPRGPSKSWCSFELSRQTAPTWEERLPAREKENLHHNVMDSQQFH